MGRCRRSPRQRLLLQCEGARALASLQRTLSRPTAAPAAVLGRKGAQWRRQAIARQPRRPPDPSWRGGSDSARSVWRHRERRTAPAGRPPGPGARAAHCRDRWARSPTRPRGRWLQQGRSPSGLLGNSASQAGAGASGSQQQTANDSLETSIPIMGYLSSDAGRTLRSIDHLVCSIPHRRSWRRGGEWGGASSLDRLRGGDSWLSPHSFSTTPRSSHHTRGTATFYEGTCRSASWV